MWMILLAKYWKECVLFGLLLTILSWHLIDERIDNARYEKLFNKSARCVVGWDQCAVDYGELALLNAQRNAEVEKWRATAETRAEALEIALSAPPAVIYRDKIVEVPSIVTGDCEQVFDDIAEYMVGVIQ